MLFDFAATLIHGQRIRGATEAIETRNWAHLAQLVEEGLDPNQKLSTKSLTEMARQGAKYTTPLLAMSMYQIGGDGRQGQIQPDAYCLLLAKGGDPFLAVGNDKRNAFDHLVNIRNLRGIQLIANAGIDVRKANLEANKLSWEEGAAWASEYRAQKDALDLAQETPETPAARARHRF